MRTPCRTSLALTLAVGASAALSLPSNTAYAQAFGGTIDRWNTQDTLNPPESGSILFVGSSSIRRWEQLALDFADYKILQRGFGGSQFEDLNFFINDIVLSKDLTAIVVWEGTNDLSSGESGNEVFSDYQTFVNAVHAAQPDVEIFYLGVTRTLANGPTTAARDSANGQIAAAAAMDPKLHYIDLPTFFYDTLANDPALFQSFYVDALHLTREGYDAWTTIVRPAVEAVVAPNKVYAPNPLTPQPGSSIFFDFGPSNTTDGDQTASPDTNGNHWNNWHPAVGEVAIDAGEQIGDLIDSTGAATGVDLIITGGFQSNGKVNGGLLSPNPALLGDLAIADATEDYFFSGADNLVGFGNDDVPGGFMLTGLDPNEFYSLSFFGSRNTTTTRVTEYRVTGTGEAAATLGTSGSNIGNDGVYDGNDDEIATVGPIAPDAFGQLFVDITVLEGDFAYLNAMRIDVVDQSLVSIGEDPVGMIVDAGQTLSFSATVTTNEPAVSLQWSRDGSALSDDARISGATTDTLTIADAELADNGLYTLTATVTGDSATSAAAAGAVREGMSNAAGPADLDENGTVDVFDLIAFLQAFSAALSP